MDEDDDMYGIDRKNLEAVAEKIALYCLPGSATPGYEKDRIYWKALQMAWLTPSTVYGTAMLKELKELKRIGEHEHEVEAAAAIIRKYRARTFPDPRADRGKL